MAADGSPVDETWPDTVARVAQAAAAVEVPSVRQAWAETFADAIGGFAFLPAGRILAGAGAKRRVTLFNCFVMGRIDDDLSAIFDRVKEAALTMQQGGGIGHDFSTLRPKGALVASLGADASGPVSFMEVWDAMCRTIQSAGQRRGAMMATLRCDHPDIEIFIDAKREAGRLNNFNLSVLVTDAFVEAVRQDRTWDLVFDGKVHGTVPARALWDRLMRATYEAAEPGVIFIDRMNARNGLGYCETIQATNPCGEQPLPPYGACLLGSINLTQLVSHPFTPSARLDLERLGRLTATAVRFLDNIIDASGYPLEAQKAEALAKRRIGLGITGLADALIMLGVTYGSRSALKLVGSWLADIKVAAYRTSAELAREKGSFPLFDRDAVLAGPTTADLPTDVRSMIHAQGMRNGLLTSIAPTGTISLLAGNISSGIEPVFDIAYDRRMLGADGKAKTVRVEDYAAGLYKRLYGVDAPLPVAVVTAAQLTPRAHLEMQAAAQQHIDSAISKTINCPEDLPFEDFKDIYLNAFDLGLKGITTYRPNTITGAILSSVAGAQVVAEVVQQPKPSFARPTAFNESAEIVYMTAPLKREPVLAGFTYKLAWPATAHALYITINDTEIGGRRRPFEIFINTKTLEHHAWTVALTRMISAVFRRGGDVSFVVEELKAIVDPQGGSWLNGQYVPSLIAAIGGVIETHLLRIDGLVADSEEIQRSVSAGSASSGNGPVGKTTAETTSSGNEWRPEPAQVSTRLFRGTPSTCPRCGSPAYVLREGCWTCSTCGHSNCS